MDRGNSKIAVIFFGLCFFFASMLIINTATNAGEENFCTIDPNKTYRINCYSLKGCIGIRPKKSYLIKEAERLGESVGIPRTVFQVFYPDKITRDLSIIYKDRQGTIWPGQEIKMQYRLKTPNPSFKSPFSFRIEMSSKTANNKGGSSISKNCNRTSTGYKVLSFRLIWASNEIRDWVWDFKG